MKTPIISVIMPVYNAEPFLHDSIPSVLNQSFTDFEYLILDDGSTDNSKEIIMNHYKDPRIKLIKLKNNYIRTLNLGLRIAKGKYIVRMDADDIMIPERLEAQYIFMENNPEIDACGGNMKCFGDRESIYNSHSNTEEIHDRMILGNPIANPTSIIRTITLRKNQIYYRPEYKYAEDYKLWLDISQIGKLANMKKVLLYYRISGGQISQTRKETQERLAEKIQKEAIELRMKEAKITLSEDIN